MSNITIYEDQYNESKFWKKLFKVVRLTGVGIIEKALVLYYSAKDEATPKWAKSVVFGALGYFVFPLDAIPDVIPVAGYTDDLSVLAAALATVVVYVKDEHKQKARAKVENILK
ncbi:MAG: YkvA family protein [Candidatus Kapaibacterium sp.]